VSSRTARAIQRNPVSKKQKQTKKSYYRNALRSYLVHQKSINRSDILISLLYDAVDGLSCNVYCSFVSGSESFLCLASDSAFKAVPVSNIAPAAVGRERHSCDALNRWVKMAAVYFFFFTSRTAFPGLTPV
jgi:hypothetical protein